MFQPEFEDACMALFLGAWMGYLHWVSILGDLHGRSSSFSMVSATRQEHEYESISMIKFSRNRCEMQVRVEVKG